jgi:hypothetical protein
MIHPLGKGVCAGREPALVFLFIMTTLPGKSISTRCPPRMNRKIRFFRNVCPGNFFMVVFPNAQLIFTELDL